MKRFLTSVMTVFVLAAFAIMPLWAVDNEGEDYEKLCNRQEQRMGCKLQGSWFLELQDIGTWSMTFHGTSDNNGTGVWEFVLTADPNCPGCSWSSARGVWTKSGPGTYDYTFQTYLVGSTGGIMMVALNKGTIILSDCNAAGFTATAEYYAPGADEPFFTYPVGYTPMHRLLLNQPDPIQ